LTLLVLCIEARCIVPLWIERNLVYNIALFEAVHHPNY
jgi:hypothetical protein